MQVEGKGAGRKQVRTLFGSLPAILLACIIATGGCSSGEPARSVVVYTSTDQTEASRIFSAFEKETGIIVKAVFDIEAQKTTGLANRLIAEMPRPQADVFWNNELSRTLLLFEKGALVPYQSPSAADIPDQWKDADHKWASFSWRARVIAYNTDLVKDEDVPRTLEDLTKPEWKGRVAIANPLFGTTAAHTAAIAAVLGEKKALDYFRRLKANGVRVYEGNSVVRDAVANGEVLVGLTDTDDVALGMKSMPIDMILPDQREGEIGTLVVPNSVALVAGAPHEAEAIILIDYLLSRKAEEPFSDPARGQYPVRQDAATPLDVARMGVDWRALSATTTPFSRKAAQILTD